MKEFMLFISGAPDPMHGMSPEEMQQHIQKIGAYIQDLTKQGRLKGVSPLESNGVKISGNKGNITDGPFNETKEVICGYYHILAKDLDEAVAIAKKDPRFEEDGAWKIEVRPLLQVDGIN